MFLVGKVLHPISLSSPLVSVCYALVFSEILIQVLTRTIKPKFFFFRKRIGLFQKKFVPPVEDISSQFYHDALEFSTFFFCINLQRYVPVVKCIKPFFNIVVIFACVFVRLVFLINATYTDNR